MTATLVVKMNYIEIPILLKLKIPAGPVLPNFYVGPALGLRAGVGGFLQIDDDKEEFTDEMKENLKEQTNVIDFGLAMGGGLDIVAGPGRVLIDIRYTLGFIQGAKLTKEMEDAGLEKDDLPPDKNGALSFLVGYAIDFGGK